MVSTLDRSLATAAPPKYHGTVFHGDGREEALLKHLQSLPSLSEHETSSLPLQDRSQRVLDAIHEFGKGENRYLMSVGETKGRQVEDLVKSKKPKVGKVTVGAHRADDSRARLIRRLLCHFLFEGEVSQTLGGLTRQHLLKLYPDGIFPAHWQAAGTSQDRVGYVSLEKSSVYAATAQGAVDLAGLHEVVKFVIGSSTTSIKSLRQTLDLPRPFQFDMVFLDHLKPLYTIDLKVLEEEGLVGPGTILVADNVVKPGNPAYLSWVRATPAQKRQSLQAGRLEKQPATTPNPSDAEWATAFREGPIDETRWVPDEAEGVVAQGDPSLVYSSDMLDGWDPYTGEKDACEVSVCTGRE